ncbi:MAG: cupin domain-containing protein [Asgard group archaeon]|nr:cupin domain-containing protein [Asgard group archaeon]
MEKRVFQLDTVDWKNVRPDLATNIFGKRLFSSDESDLKFTLTRVEPNGEFKSHSDTYHHVFYFIEGTGILFIADESYKIQPGLVAHIPSGVEHSYKNLSGKKELFLLTCNIPP